MPNLKSSIFCKILALVLCIFLAFEVSYIQAYQATDQMNQQFNSAKEAYFADDFEGAKATLEILVSSIAQLEGMDSFKGEVYLLMGAAYEKLEFNNLAIKYFCMAKDILGDGKSIEGLDLNSLILYWTQCLTAGGIAISVLIIQYEDGYGAYLAGDYEESKVILERLVSIVDTLDGFESLRGETYLVLAAAYEALKYKELAIKYYCKAKEILGINVTVDGIRLSKQRWYKSKCPTGAAAAKVAVRKRRGGGGFIGFILGLGILAGLVWYLLFSKNAPLKKLLEDLEGATLVSNASACYSTRWKWHISSSWKGSIGTVTFTPNSAPFPQPSNSWEDEVTYTLSISGGGTLKECTITLEEVEIGGGDTNPREDWIWILNNLELNETNTFTEPCSNPGSKTYSNVWTKTYTTKGSHQIPAKHKMEVQGITGASVSSSMSVTKK